MKRSLGLVVFFAIAASTLAIDAIAQEAGSSAKLSVLISCIPKHEPFTLSLGDLSSKNGVLKTLTPVSNDVRIDYVLLFDISASVRENYRLQLANAEALLHTLVRKDKDRGNLILIDQKLRTSNQFTTDPEAILKAIRTVQLGGGTALFDGLKLGVSQLEKLPDPGLRLILVVSDGEDTWSRSLREEAFARVLESGTHVIAVSPYDSGMESRGDRALERFTTGSGGWYISSRNQGSSKVQFAKLKYLFDHWYGLEIAPTKPDQKVWKRDLKTNAKCELVAPEEVKFDH